MKGFLGAFFVFVFWVSGGLYYISKTNPSLSQTDKPTQTESVRAVTMKATPLNKEEVTSPNIPTTTNLTTETTEDSLTASIANTASNSQLLADELKKSITISDTIDINKGEPEVSFEEPLSEKEEEEIATKLFYPRYTASQELILDKKLVEYAKELKQLLKENPDKKITIIGHTDNIGSAKDNFAIALKKSRQVKWYLTARKGLPRSKIKATSKGEQEPIESNNSNWGRRKNNRIEIIVD